jgi:uncharacterized protein
MSFPDKGWQTETVSDTDEFRYSTASFDGDALLGVMDGTTDLTEGVSSNWFDAEDTPYGRLAAVADCTGAGFNLSSLQ